MRKIILSLIIVIGMSNISYSQVTGAAALIALDQVDAMLTKQIQSIGNLVTNAVGSTGNMLLSVSARLRKDINETIGNTDKVLRENQVNMFNLLINLKDEYSAAIEKNIATVDVTATKVTQALNDLVVKKKEPNIFQYVTSPFIRGYSNYYTFKVKGTSFDRSEKVYILINGKKIAPIQSNYSELVFKIDSSDIQTADMQEHFSRAKIVFEYEKGLFNKDMIKEEPFIIPITPLNVGIATAYYEQLLPEVKYYDLTYSCDCSTGPSGWDGGKEKNSKNFNILPTNGRKIDINSIQVKKWEQRHGGGNHFNVKTEQQIAGKITCQSDGKPKGGGGFSTLTFAYREFETIYNNHKKSITNNSISSINPAIFNLPDPVDNKRPNLSYISVKTFDGKDITLVPTDSNRYFKLSVNPVTDDVVLSWK